MEYPFINFVLVIPIILILTAISVIIHEEVHILQMQHHENLTVHNIIFLPQNPKDCGDEFPLACINYTNTGGNKGIINFNKEAPSLEIQADIVQFLFVIAATMIIIRILPQ